MKSILCAVGLLTASLAGCTSSNGPTCTGSTLTCSAATDCPVSTTLCASPACTAGCCATTNADAGTMCSDTNGSVCDGAGKCVACLAATDCLAPATLCLTNTCDATKHTCGTTNTRARQVCSDSAGKLCDGNGNCVQCLADTDCPASTTACITSTCDLISHECVVANQPQGTHCFDNGGSLCNPFGQCLQCLTASDCPAQPTACVVNTCDPATAMCGTASAMSGTPCTDVDGGVCDGVGTCQPCTADAGCAP